MKFNDNELIYSAEARCNCGAGLAYVTLESLEKHGLDIRDFWYWDCSDILTGRAISKRQEGCKKHSDKFPFAFYEIKSENQSSANGRTTRRRNK